MDLTVVSGDDHPSTLDYATEAGEGEQVAQRVAASAD
jgi:hypothetical protein